MIKIDKKFSYLAILSTNFKVKREIKLFIFFLINLFSLCLLNFLLSSNLSNFYILFFTIISLICWSSYIVFILNNNDFFIYFSVWIFWIIGLLFLFFLNINLSNFENFQISIFAFILTTFFIHQFVKLCKKITFFNKLGFFSNTRIIPILFIFIAPIFAVSLFYESYFFSNLFVSYFINFNFFILFLFFPFLLYFYIAKFEVKKELKFQLILISLLTISYFLLTNDVFVFFIPLLYWPSLFVLVLFLIICSVPLYLNLVNGFLVNIVAINLIISFIVINILIIIFYNFAFKFNFKINIITNKNKKHVNMLSYVGGKNNILDSTYCMTRIRLIVKDPNLISEDMLKKNGAYGIIKNNQSIHIIFGSKSEYIYKNFFY